MSGAVDEGSLASGLRKARWRILPLLSVCYLVAYMDRANISFAAETMNRDLHFTPAIYGLGAGLFFVSYGLMEVPSNSLMLRFGARRWLGRIMLTWGLVAAGMMFVRTPAHFYGARLLLGCAEAGYFPGALYFLSQWFPRSVRAGAISLFYVSLPLSTLVMGGVAGMLLGLNGKLGLAGWQWMFLVEAVPAVLLAFAVWFALPDSIAGARWLTGAEKASLTAELLADEPGGAAADDSIANGLRRAFSSGRMWALGLVYFFELGSNYAVIFSLPIVLGRATGWNAARVGYLVAATGAVGAMLMVGGAWVSDRTGRPRPITVGGFALMAIGMAVAGTHLQGWVGAIALLGTALSFYVMQGPMLWVMSTLLPGRASAIAIAAVNMCAIFGGFVGPVWMGWMHGRTGGYGWGIGLLCIPCAIASGIMVRLAADNTRGTAEIDASSPLLAGGVAEGELG